MIRLFLNDKEVELTESVSFAINKQFEDISSPTDIKNDWSKTVEIPFTQHNNKLFGDLFSPDRMIVEGDSTLMGIYFDPYKKIDFRLQWDDTIIMKGYAKIVNVIKDSGDYGHYNITLNGELGKVFQEVMKITFDTNTENQEYLIDGSKYASGIVDKDLIKQCFEAEQQTVDLKTVDQTDYAITDILGFAPNNSFVDDFDYKCFEYTYNHTKEFATELGELVDGDGNPTFASYTGVEPSTAIGDGLLPRQVGEFRSYLQLPFIYFNKLFQIFVEKTKDVTGYDVELDKSWFDSNNPYWSRIVYMLSGFYEENKDELSNAVIGTDGYFRGGLGIYDTNDTPRILGNYGTWKNKEGTEILDSEGYFFIEDSTEYTITTIPNNIEIRTLYGGNVSCRINPKQAFFIDLQFTHRFTQETESVPLYAIVDNSVTRTYDGYTMVHVGELAVEEVEGANWWVLRADLPEATRKHIMNIASEYRQFDINYTVKQIDMQSSYLNYRFVETTETGGTNYVNQNTIFILNYNTAVDTIKFEWLAKTIRSKYYFTLNSLWNKEYNLFNEILKYCKQFRIGIFCDDINKKLTFKPFNRYFKDYTVSDWTEKLDLSKEYTIKPITFENKYLLFNYKDNDISILKDYKSRYGVNYGEYKLITEYNFNDDTQDLLKDINNSVVYSPSVLSYNTLLNQELVYIIPNEVFVNNSDDKNNNVDIFGSMFFNCGTRDFDTELGNVYITDDTDYQKSSEVFTYLRFDEGNRVKITKYQYLDNVCDGNLLYFSIPFVNYTIVPNNYDNTNDIYKNFWKKYLDERYDKQNKIVTCYLKLTPHDIVNFQYNNFIKIENQLYMVNKIYDYQINENISTKVDLITIQDITGYTDVSTDFYKMKVFRDYNTLWDAVDDYIYLKYGDTKTIYISSNSDVSWLDIYEEDSSLDSIQGVLINGSAGRGTIEAGYKVPVVFSNEGAQSGRGKVRFTNEQGETITILVVTA